MAKSFSIDVRSSIRDQLETLDNFVTALLPSLGSSDAFAYLDRWEAATKDRVTGLLSITQLQAFKNARLKQRFELPEEDQIKQLIVEFKSVLEGWLAELG